MNILFLDQFSDLGGAQRCLLDLLPAVLERGWHAHVAAPGDGELGSRSAALGAEFHPIHCGPYGSGYKSAGDLARFVAELPALARRISLLARETKADILYVNGPRLLPASGFSSLPIVFHCHSYLGQGYAAALAGISLSGARVIGSCGFVLEPLKPFVASDRMEVVYNGCADVASQPPHEGEQLRIGMIGRIAPEKGQLDFIQAARMLPASWQYIVCGTPLFSNPTAALYLEQVRQAAAGLPVDFLGWRDDIGAVLSSLDLLVVPSTQVEATTRVIIEAYAAGVPVVASSSGGIPEIVREGETGFLVPSGDPARLAAVIRRALADHAALSTITRNARRVWSERFTLPEYQRRILNILERVGSSARA